MATHWYGKIFMACWWLNLTGFHCHIHVWIFEMSFLKFHPGVNVFPLSETYLQIRQILYKNWKGVSLFVSTLLLGVIFRSLRVTKSKCVSFGAKDAYFINNLFINPIMYFIIQFTKFWWWDVSEITSSFVMIVNFFHYLSCMYQWNLDNRSEHFGKNSRYNIKYTFI